MKSTAQRQLVRCLPYLQDLRNRGAKEIDLIVTDGHDGILAAVGSLFTATPRQGMFCVFCSFLSHPTIFPRIWLLLCISQFYLSSFLGFEREYLLLGFLLRVRTQQSAWCLAYSSPCSRLHLHGML